MRLRRASAALALGFAPALAAAHGTLWGGEGAHAPVWLAQALFATAWLGWGLGATRVRPTFLRRLALHGAMLVGGLALFGPLDELAEQSTAWHMGQHMLLIVVAAPLGVIARPLPQWRAAFGAGADAIWRALMRLAGRPLACALLHAAAIWIWHAPAPYMAAIFNNWLHVLEHACFLLTGWLLWWSALRTGRQGALGSALALLFTLMQTGLLGALLTFAPEPLYWRESRDLWDQQLAGLLMWIPGGIAYLLGIGWLGWRLLGDRDEAGTQIPVQRLASRTFD